LASRYPTSSRASSVLARAGPHDGTGPELPRGVNYSKQAFSMKPTGSETCYFINNNLACPLFQLGEFKEVEPLISLFLNNAEDPARKIMDHIEYGLIHDFDPFSQFFVSGRQKSV